MFSSDNAVLFVKNSRSFSSNRILNVLALSAFCASYTAQNLSRPKLSVFVTVIFFRIYHLNMLSFVKFQAKLINFHGTSESSAIILNFEFCDVV